jgi:hypothetical protein
MWCRLRWSKGRRRRRACGGAKITLSWRARLRTRFFRETKRLLPSSEGGEIGLGNAAAVVCRPGNCITPAAMAGHACLRTRNTRTQCPDSNG